MNLSLKPSRLGLIVLTNGFAACMLLSCGGSNNSSTSSKDSTSELSDTSAPSFKNGFCAGDTMANEPIAQFGDSAFSKEDSANYYVYESKVYTMEISAKDLWKAFNASDFHHIYFTFSLKNPFKVQVESVADDGSFTEINATTIGDAVPIRSTGSVPSQRMWVRPAKSYYNDVCDFLNGLKNNDHIDLEQNGDNYTIRIKAARAEDHRHNQYISLEGWVFDKGDKSVAQTYSTTLKTNPCPYCR
ncbi:MAG TPA: hypothetical protein VEV83_16225 [Parafilimonas sp.]|nr:hypothetical protein [Parafilimonas sp.]